MAENHKLLLIGKITNPDFLAMKGNLQSNPPNCDTTIKTSTKENASCILLLYEDNEPIHAWSGKVDTKNINHKLEELC